MTDQSLEQLHASLNDAIEDADLEAMDEISQQIHEFEQGGNPEDVSTEINVAEAEQVTDDASRGDDADEPKETTDEIKDEITDEPEEKPDGVLSKNGERVIPYEQLEAARQRSIDLESQIEQMRDNPETSPEVQEQLGRLTRLVETYESQIKGSGMEPRPLPEEFRLDAAKLKELEEFGTVGEVSTTLAKQIEYLLGEVKEIKGSPKPVASEQEPVSANSVDEVIAADADLTRWKGSDFAWDKAVSIDGYVKTLPEFAGKSFSERKDEVVRRTKLELGEAAAQPSQQPPGKTAEEIVAGVTDTPTSLSEIGGATARQEATFAQQTEGKSEIEIASLMSERLDRGERIDDLL